MSIRLAYSALTALAVTGLALTGVASAQDMAITNGKVWTGTATGTLDSATLLIEDGRVTALGASVDIPAGMDTIDADGHWVTPGLYAPFSRTGIVEVSAEDDTNDTSASSSSYTASLRAVDGFNPAATPIAITRIEGITRLAVAPSTGASLFAGQGFLATTSGKGDSVTEPRAFMYIALGENGADLAGGSRPAAWAALRGAIADARGYPGRFIAHTEGDTLNRADAQAFGDAVRGQQLLLISAHRASDIRQIISLKQDIPNLNIAIVGADEAWLVADDLRAADIPVIIDPFSNLPASFSQLGATQYNAERLFAAGVTTAFAHLGDNSHQARLVVQTAGNAVANGLSFDNAMAGLTTGPAEIFGGEATGKLEPGAVADVVIWDGDPLEVMSAPTRIFINGVDQSLESRQTKLRDRYLDLDESETPLAFKR